MAHHAVISQVGIETTRGTFPTVAVTTVAAALWEARNNPWQRGPFRIQPDDVKQRYLAAALDALTTMQDTP
jgi:hypothetical protein